MYGAGSATGIFHFDWQLNGIGQIGLFVLVAAAQICCTAWLLLLLLLLLLLRALLLWLLPIKRRGNLRKGLPACPLPTSDEPVATALTAIPL